MSPFFVDFHAHLEHELFAGVLSQVVERAKQAGVRKIISAGSSRHANEQQLAIRKRFPDAVEVVLGIAPHAHKETDLREALAFVKQHEQEIAGIGEIGLDLHHFGPETLDDQKTVFVAQLELAEQLGLPVVVHSRKAEEQVLELLAEFAGVKAVLHFFLVPKLAFPAVERGCLLSLPTIKSSSKAKIAREVPLKALACETDSPFGLGAGSRSEPKDVALAYEEIAGEKKKPVEEVVQAICGNAEKFFGIRLE